MILAIVFAVIVSHLHVGTKNYEYCKEKNFEAVVCDEARMFKVTLDKYCEITGSKHEDCNK